MMSAAIIMMKFDVILSELSTGPVSMQCVELKKALHDQSTDMVKIFQDVESYYVEHIEKAKKNYSGSIAHFLDVYLEQVESLLALFSACCQGDWEAWLAALDNEIKYFFAADLLNYARLMPLHLAQMNEQEKEDPLTWDYLKAG